MSRDLGLLTGSFPVSTGVSALALERGKFAGRKKEGIRLELLPTILALDPGWDIFGLFLPNSLFLEDHFSECKTTDLRQTSFSAPLK